MKVPSSNHLVYQDAAGKGNGPGAVIVFDAGGLAGFAHVEAAGLHGGDGPLGEAAGPVRTGALAADAAGPRRQGHTSMI